MQGAKPNSPDEVDGQERGRLTSPAAEFLIMEQKLAECEDDEKAVRLMEGLITKALGQLAAKLECINNEDEKSKLESKIEEIQTSIQNLEHIDIKPKAEIDGQGDIISFTVGDAAESSLFREQAQDMRLMAKEERWSMERRRLWPILNKCRMALGKDIDWKEQLTYTGVTADSEKEAIGKMRDKPGVSDE